MDNSALVTLIRENAVPLEPRPPVLPPEWEALVRLRVTRPYRAFLFDVYGTLFCSAAGDIGVTAEQTGTSAALEALAARIDRRLTGGDLRRCFHLKAAAIHRREKARTDFPEVKVDEIWADFLRERGLEASSAQAREFALRYELAVNPACPMPRAREAVAALKKSNCLLGIVSNAQFFTPLLFEAFWGGTPREAGFDSDLLFYSYEQGEAKPSPRLFARVRDCLARRGIDAGDCAVIGNDMRGDIYGAQTAGFDSILFAGDSRSLRLRENDALVSTLKPALVIRGFDALIPAQ